MTTDRSGDADVSPPARKARRLIVDAISEGIVRVEDDGRMLEMPRWMFPRQMREGDVLAATTESAAPDALTLQFQIDSEAKEEIQRELSEMVEELGASDTGGDIAL